MNNISDLKTLFYEEHARDRRLTFINYAIIVGIIILFFMFLSYMGVSPVKFISAFFNQGPNDGSSISSYYSIVFPLMVGLIMVGYPAFLLWKISKRPKKIDELLLRAGKGARPASIDEAVEYKVTIPLLKINFKLCPVTFVTIYMEGDNSPYKLPIRSAYVPDMKIILSGASMEAINEIKNDLYTLADTDSSDTNTLDGSSTPTPIKSIEDFKSFIDKELSGDLKDLEASRKSSRRATLIGGALAGIVTIGIIGYFWYKNSQGTSSQGSFPIMTVVGIIGFIIAIGFNFVMKSKRPKVADGQPNFVGNSFKDKIMTRMVHFINPSLTYVPMAHLGLGEINESGLFEQKQYTVNGSDHISGRHSGVPFISSNLSLYYKENFTEEREAPKCAFSGQFFVARFNKKFSAPIYVIPRKNKYDTVDFFTNDKGEEVKLEDPEFMKMFKVYAEDQVTARYILTPSLMERIKGLAKRDKGAYHFVFSNNNITVANNSGEGSFEISPSRSITANDNQQLIDFYSDLCNQFSIIDELKLNINIWRK